MRSTLCYVLQNARRHGEAIDLRFGGMDPFSSSWWFDGWKDDSWREGVGPPEMRTVADAETWLLKTGWKRSKCGSCARETGLERELDNLWCYSCSPRCASSAARVSSMSSQRAS